MIHGSLFNARSFLVILLLSFAIEPASAVRGSTIDAVRRGHGGITAVPLVYQPSTSAEKGSEGSEFAGGTPASILHQQQINRGWKRLALMTHRPIPSDRQLLSNLHQRMRFLSDPLKKLYAYKQLGQWLEGQTNEPSAQPPVTTRLDIQADDIGYMATFEIGTPARPFKLLVDSGSADFWVGEDQCRGDDGSDCGDHVFLGPSSSKTFKAPDPSKMGESSWRMVYMSGAVSGYIGEDTVSVAGLSMVGHRFGVAQNESSEFKYVPFDGIVGFAKAAVSRMNVPTFLNALYQQKLVDRPIVSYHLPRKREGKGDGEMTLGGLNPLAYQPGSLVHTPNVNKFGFWETNLDAVHVGNATLSPAQRSMVLDTGTALMVIPEKDAREIHTAIPGSVFSEGAWMVPCTMTTTIVVTIQGQQFSIDPRDIAFTPIDDRYPEGMCWSGIGVGSLGPYNLEHQWLAGAVFIKNVYFSSDDSKNEISFARLRN